MKTVCILHYLLQGKDEGIIVNYMSCVRSLISCWQNEMKEYAYEKRQQYLFYKCCNFDTIYQHVDRQDRQTDRRQMDVFIIAVGLKTTSASATTLLMQHPRKPV